MDMITNI